MPNKYIVVENSSFKVIESESEPINLVLNEPNRTWSNNDYTIVNNGIKIYWLDDYNDRSIYKCLTVKYKDVVLLKENAVRKIQIVADALNEFKNISAEDLEKKYHKALKDEKSELAIEVEELRDKKINAKEEAKKYTELVEKVKEVFLIIKDLDNT